MKKVIAIILCITMFMMVIPVTLSASTVAEDNKMLFAVTDDADGKLYYTGYKYGVNGLGYAKKGLMRTSQDTGFTTGDGSAYLFAHETGGEQMWKFQFNVNAETGGHALASGGSTFIFPFYSTTETLADNVENPEDYTHMAVRVKLVDDGTGNAVEGATHSFSLNPYGATTTDGYYGSWADKGNVYFQDINTGEKTYVNASTMDLPLGFDGYVVFPSNAVTCLIENTTENEDGTTTTTKTKAHTSLADFAKLHIFIHWNCNHSSRKATDSWVGTELYIGDMILTKNIDSFNLQYGAPAFELTSNDNSVAVISDDTNAVYSFTKDAEAWLTKDEFNAAAKNLEKATKYTVYAKYPEGTKIISREIATTNTGIAGYLMDVPEEDTYLNYNNKYIGWGTRIVMTSGTDPLSDNPTYAGGSSQGLFVRQSGEEHFIVLNPQEVAHSTSGLIQESNVALNFNTISGRGLNEDGTVKAGMPENIDKATIKGIAIRFKITGGEADQYSSMSFYLPAKSDFLQLSRAYLIDNETGLVMNPYWRDNSKGHLLTITGEFDGWIVLPYEYVFASHREYLETSGASLQLFFHTEACTQSNHGKDTASKWANKILWLGDIALIDNEDAFLNTYSRPITDSEGMTFTSNDFDTIDGAFSEMTNTFEAWVKFPENYPTTIRGGIMLSNAGNASNSVTYQILANGNPSVSSAFYSYGQSTDSYTKTFDEVNLYNGEWTHLAVVNDQTANTMTCYVNGEAVQTLEGALTDAINREAGVLGGNFSPGNPLAFRGEMKSVALYSDVRTAEEIAADMTTVGTDGLMAHWDLSKDAVDGKIADESGNGHDITIGEVWFKNENTATDYDYSFVIVGDTQYVNYNWHDRYDDIYDWIVANKESRKIEYVLNMGDITENSADAQWARAATEHAKLDGLVPYTVLRGNHDKTDGLNATFNKAPYNTSYAESYDGKVENTWRELVVGDIKYLIFTLDIGPDDDVLNWAGEIIADHPYHNVIITTHAYLDTAGELMDSKYNSNPTNSTYGGGDNDAQEMWDKLISKYENIVMVLCGHVSANTAVTTTKIGDNGNVVTQMLIDPQGVDNAIGATGMITLLNFSENGSKISVETYSTVRDMHFISQGQYDITVPVTQFVDIKGDVSGNGIRDTRDLAAMRKYLMGILSESGLTVDVNDDSDKDIRDLVALKRLFIAS